MCKNDTFYFYRFYNYCVGVKLNLSISLLQKNITLPQDTKRIYVSNTVLPAKIQLPKPLDRDVFELSPNVNFMGELFKKPTKSHSNSIKPNLTLQDHFDSKKGTRIKGSTSTTQQSEQVKEKKETVQDKQKKVVRSLGLFNSNAEKSFDSQMQSTGLFSKTIDMVFSLWNSKNSTKIVKEDLKTAKEELIQLDKSIEEGNFNEKFKEIFKIDYNQENMDNFYKANETLMLATTTKYMADTMQLHLEEPLKKAKKNNGKLANYVEGKVLTTVSTGSVPYVEYTYPKAKVYEEMEQAVKAIVGNDEALESILLARGIKEPKKASQEEKYKAYVNVANYFLQTSTSTAKRCSKDKSLKDLKKDYDSAYEKAFGKDNDIQKRVDNYNRSQNIGKSLLKSTIRNPLKYAIMGLIGATAGPLVGVGVGVAASFGLDMLDEATQVNNEEDEGGLFSKENMKQLMKETAISYTDYAICEAMEAVVPNLKTSSDIVNALLDTTRRTTLDVTSGLIYEYLYSGEWRSDQIAPRAFMSAVFGKMSVDDPLAKELLSLTKNGVKRSLLYEKDEKSSVKQFLNKMQVELQKEYVKNPELYSGMKMLSMSNPKAYENMMAELLQQHIDSIASQQTESKQDSKKANE